MTHPTVAIVHDYLTQRGGAERVVLSMLRMFPDAPLFTALYAPDSTYPEFANYDVRPLWTNRIAFLRRDHRRGLFLYPFVFAGLRVDADLVLCSSSGFAHGVKTRGRKVVYCHTPARWLYDEADTYFAGWPAPIVTLARAAGPALRHWDKRAAGNSDTYLSNSVVVRERINLAYRINADVLAPPVATLADGARTSLPGIEAGYFLCVSRLMGYKNVGAVVAAFEHLPEARLVVIGEGPERPALEAIAGPNVSLRGRVDDAELSWLYAQCAGVISASYEDFGLTPLEAASYGKPVAVLRAGGFLDTVVDGQTGVFFDTPDASTIATAVQRLRQGLWSPPHIRSHAENFAESSFSRRLRDTMGLTLPSVPETTPPARQAA